MKVQTLDDLKNTTHIPVVITDQQGFITYVNDCFTQVFGWSSAEVMGEIITIIIPNGFHDAHHLGFSRFLSTQKSTVLNHPLHLRGITKDGREIEAEHWIMAEQHRGEWQFAALLRPLNSNSEQVL